MIRIRSATHALTAAALLALSGCGEQTRRPEAGPAATDPSAEAPAAQQVPVEPPADAQASAGPDTDSAPPPGAPVAAEATTEPPAIPEPPPTAVQAPQPGSQRPSAPAQPRFARKSAVYDRSGSGYQLLQSPASAMRGFPTDNLGRIDWVEALSRGLIAPRAALHGKGSMQRKHEDVIMRNTRDMPWVRFPHAQHTEWLACSNCHPRPFKQEIGVHGITMDTIMRGDHCGKCHDRVAFSIFACERCHSVTHPGSPPAWW